MGVARERLLFAAFPSDSHLLLFWRQPDSGGSGSQHLTLKTAQEERGAPQPASPPPPLGGGPAVPRGSPAKLLIAWPVAPAQGRAGRT